MKELLWEEKYTCGPENEYLIHKRVVKHKGEIWAEQFDTEIKTFKRLEKDETYFSILEKALSERRQPKVLREDIIVEFNDNVNKYKKVLETSLKEASSSLTDALNSYNQHNIPCEFEIAEAKMVFIPSKFYEEYACLGSFEIKESCGVLIPPDKLKEFKIGIIRKG